MKKLRLGSRLKLGFQFVMYCLDLAFYVTALVMLIMRGSKIAFGVGLAIALLPLLTMVQMKLRGFAWKKCWVLMIHPINGNSKCNANILVSLSRECNFDNI